MAWRPNLRGRTDNQVAEAVDRLYSAVREVQSRLDGLESASEPMNIFVIRDELQAGGSAPLNITGLSGTNTLSPGVDPGAVLYADSQSMIDGSLGVSGQALISGGANPPTWRDVEDDGEILTVSGTETLTGDRTIRADYGWELNQDAAASRVLAFRRSRGDEVSPADIFAGDLLGRWQAEGWRTGAFRQAGQVDWEAHAVGGSFVSGRIRTRLRDGGGDLRDVFMIRPDIVEVRMDGGTAGSRGGLIVNKDWPSSYDPPPLDGAFIVNVPATQVADPITLTEQGAISGFSLFSVTADGAVLATPAAASAAILPFGFIGDPDAGLYYDAGAVGIGIGGSEILDCEAALSTFNTNVNIHGAADPRLRISEGGSATSYLDMVDTAATQANLKKVSAAGSSSMRFDPVPSDGTSISSVQFFVETNTSGVKQFRLYQGDGTSKVRHALDSDAVVFNEQGEDIDFRVEGDTEPNLLFLDAGTDKVGVGTIPQTNLHVRESNTDTTPTVEIEQLSTGDAGLQFSIVGDAYAMGIDNSDGDKFKISYAAGAGTAVLGVNDLFVVDGPAEEVKVKLATDNFNASFQARGAILSAANDTANSAFGSLTALSEKVSLQAGKVGTVSNPTLVFNVGGVERGLIAPASGALHWDYDVEVEDGDLTVGKDILNAFVPIHLLGQTGAEFNVNRENVDFAVNSDTTSDFFFIDASANEARINNGDLVVLDGGIQRVRLRESGTSGILSLYSGGTETVRLEALTTGRSIIGSKLLVNDTQTSLNAQLIVGGAITSQASDTPNTEFVALTHIGPRAIIQVGEIGTGALTKLDFDVGGSVRGSMEPDGGLVWGSPTGGSQGAGTINAQAVYDDGALLADWIFDLHYGGETCKEDRDRARGSAPLMSVSETEAFVRSNRRLPSLPSRAEWSGNHSSLGSLVTSLWETVERQQLHIFELERRISALCA